MVRTKTRRLLLLNDRVVCVAVAGRPSEPEFVVPPGATQPVPGQHAPERLSLKWSAHVSEVSGYTTCDTCPHYDTRVSAGGGGGGHGVGHAGPADGGGGRHAGCRGQEDEPRQDKLHHQCQ